jgi:hypothetical protein
MKVNENYRIITLHSNGTILKSSARYTASLVKKLEELELVVRQLMHLPFLLLSEIMLRKEI